MVDRSFARFSPASCFCSSSIARTTSSSAAVQGELATYIPNEGKCYSACSFIFLAGVERKDEGELGVHQISLESGDLVSAQLTIADIIDVLGRFDTPTGVLTVMLQTPPDQIHIFSPDEVARFGINRERSDLEDSPTSESARTERRPDGGEAIHLNPSSSTASTTAAPDHLGHTKLSKLSAIEEYTRRPTRIAVFAGLDFFGDDIASGRTEDAVACARKCLSMSGQCEAFTFNTDPHIARGPNCFLKASRGTADGNAVAVSGVLLSSADPDPKPFSMGVIDPKTALYEDVDLRAVICRLVLTDRTSAHSNVGWPVSPTIVALRLPISNANESAG